MKKTSVEKQKKAWAFYDWANSVYSLVISTAIFPIYYHAVSGGDNAQVSFLGTTFNNATLYSYALSFSFIIVVLLSPFLSGIADYTGRKKFFLKLFCYMGSFSVMALYFFESIQTVWVGIVFTIMASVGFWSSLVFYNAYLNEISTLEERDMVSAKGFIQGYIGSVILLVICLVIQLKPMVFGLPEGTLPSRICFLIVGIWWMGFAQYSFKYLPADNKTKIDDKSLYFSGYRELKKVVRQVKNQFEIKAFLVAFFLYSVGVQTIILLASLFGDKELELATEKLILTIIFIQLLGIVGAYFFAVLSKKIGNVKALQISVLIWSLITFGAYLLDKNNPNIDIQFYSLGAILGFVLGAVQSLSRSTYAKLIPENEKDQVTYFSFFDVTEKLAIIFGTFISGLFIALTGSMKLSVLMMSVFFFIGFLLLNLLSKYKKVNQST